MMRKLSAALSVLIFMTLIAPLDIPFIRGILQPNPALAQGTPVLEDFALYSRKEIKLSNIGESRGNVGSNGSIDIKKGTTGSVIGSFRALDRLNNEAEIGIYGDVTAAVIVDRGSLSLSGQKFERADLVGLTLPALSFSSAGPNVEVPESTSMTLAPDSYGHLKLKKGAAVSLSSGIYYFVKFEIYEFASVILDVSGGAIQINIVDKMKIKDNVEMQIVDGGPQLVLFNFSGSDKVEVQDHSLLRGILTAPSAKVEFKKGSRLEGAVYADSIHLAKGASFRQYASSSDGRPPTADAGGEQTALAGEQVELDGSGSSDPDGKAVTYHWSFVSFPDGSNPALSDPAGPTPTFTADLPGVYVIELAVDDGSYTSFRDTATVTAVSKLLDVTDFVLYADDEIKIDEIAGGIGDVGANRKVHIEKGSSGKITGDLLVLDHIKNNGVIMIDGNVYLNSKIDDHGDLKMTGTVNANSQLPARRLPPISFSAEGPDLKMQASALQRLDPGSYGRVEVKKGATLQFTAGVYFLRDLKTDDSAVITFDVSQGAIELNVAKRLEFGKDCVVQITGGNTRAVRFNYAGKKEVEIEDRSVFRGTIVAPRAKVEFEKDSRLEGAVYAKKIYLDQGASFQFHEPVANDDAMTTDEDTPMTITLTGSDTERNPLTYQMISGPAHGTLTGAAPDLSYTPHADYNGPDALTFKTNDGPLESSEAVVSITVNSVNDPPVANNDAATTDEDTAVSITLTGSDIEADALTYQVSTGPAHGTLTGTAPDLTYTPNANYNGLDKFTFTANDGILDSALATVTLTVNAVNDPPVADDDSYTVDEDTTDHLFDVLSNDDDDVDDGETLTLVSLVQTPDKGGTATIETGRIKYSPAADFFGTETFIYTIHDGDEDSTDTATVTVTVEDVEDPPVADDDSYTVDEDTTDHLFDVLSNDDDDVDDGETLTLVSLVQTPDKGGTATIETGRIKYSPAADFFGTETFIYTIHDGDEDSTDTATVTVTVEDVEDPPVADDDSYTVDEDTTDHLFDVLSNDDDDVDDGETLTLVSLVQTPDKGGTATIETGRIKYSPAADFFGTETFIYTIHDGDEDSTDTATVTVTVEDVEDPPVADDDSYTVDEDTTDHLFDVLSNDDDDVDDGETLTLVSLVQTPDKGGTATIETGRIKYSPAADFFGTETFIYTIHDGDEDSTDTATVTVTVEDVEDPPVADDDSYTVDEDTTDHLFDVLSNDDDDVDDGETLTLVSLVQTPDKGGTATIETGRIKYSPAADFFGTETFIYTIHDGDEDSTDTATVTVTVEDVEDPPVADDDSYTVDEDTTDHLFDVLSNDDDDVDDGETLTLVSLVQTPDKGGTATIETGRIKYSPAADFFGTETFIYTIHDGDEDSTDTATVTVTVEDVEDPPVADDDSYTVDEDTTDHLFDVLSNDDDDVDDGETLTLVSLVQTPDKGGTATIETGRIKYSPAADFFGTETFIYTIHDGDEDSTDTATVTVTVEDVEDPPVADDDSYTVDEDTTDHLFDVLSNDDDDVDDGETLTLVSLVQTPDKGGTATIETGRIKYSPAADFFGTETFIYTIHDGDEDSTDTATVTVTVEDVEDPPVADDDSYTVDEDTTDHLFDVLSNDDDDVDDGETLTLVSLVQTPDKGGTATIETGRIKYSPAADFFGTETFIYTIHDGDEDSTDTATVTVTVEDVEDPPVADDDSYTVDEDTTDHLFDVLSNDDDDVDDGETLTLVSLVQTPDKGGTATIETGRIKYSPAADFFGTETFIYTIHDGDEDSTDTATVTVTVEDVEDPPVADDDSYTVDEDTTDHLFDVLSNDDDDVDDGETLTLVSLVQTPDKGGTATIETGRIKYSPAADFFGTETFIYTIHDGDEDSTDTATVTVTVEDVEDPPVADDDSYTVDEDTTDHLFDVLSNDDDDVDDGETLTLVSLVQTPDKGGTATIETGRIKYSPAADFFGTETFIYTIHDGDEDSTDTATVTVTVEDVEDPPVADDDSYTVDEDTTDHLFDVLSNDDDDVDDGETLTLVSLVQTPDKGGTATIETGRIKYSPAADFFGTETFIYTIHDGDEDSTDTATVTVTVEDVEDPPVADDDSYTVDEDTTDHLFDVLSNDDDDVDDGETLTLVSLVQTPDKGGTATIETGRIKYSPAADFFGTETFIYTIHDGDEDSTDTATVTVTVEDVEDPPVADDDSYTVDEDTTDHLFDVLSNDDDDVDDGETLTLVSLVQTPDKGGTATIETGRIKYSPAADFFGTETFIYTIHDGDEDSTDTATVTVTVEDVEDPPVADDDSYTVDEDTTDHLFDVLSNDDDDVDDGETLTLVSLVQTPDKGGTATIETGRIKYSPAADFFGTETFIYTIHDGDEDSTDTATVTVTVNAVNDSPVANNAAATTDEDSEVTITLTGSDIEADALTYQVIDGPANGTLTGAAPDLSYTPNADYNGLDTFTFKASDGLLDSNEATVSITVRPVNDPPEAPLISAPQNGSEVTALAFDLVVTNATDPDGDTLTYVFELDKTAAFNSPAKQTSGTISEGTDTTSWPRSGLDDNTWYYWRAMTSDSVFDSPWATGSFFVNTTNDAPTITILEPSTDTTSNGSIYNITLTWVDSDPDDNASINLYYDTDNVGTNGTLIISGLQENPDGASDSYSWNFTSIPDGSYYIYATIDDGSSISSSYGNGKITVDRTPPEIISSYPANGSTVGTQGGGALNVLIVYGDAYSTIQSVTVYEGSVDITAGVTVTGNTIGFTIPSPVNGKTYSYTLYIVDGLGNIANIVYTFTIDTTVPVTNASVAGGNFSKAFTVDLTSSEAATIYYSTDGYPPIEGASNTVAGASPVTGIAIDRSMTLQFFAKDTAGNIENVKNEVYLLGVLPGPVSDLAAVYNESLERVELTWSPQSSINGYRVYRVLSATDKNILNQSKAGKYAPPARLRHSALIPAATTSHNDTNIIAGITYYYGLTVEDNQGIEGVICDLVPVEITTGAPPLNITEAIERALAWLGSTQSKEGNWTDSRGSTILPTIAALNAYKSAGKNDAGVRQGLFYLRGHFADNNDYLARKILILNNFGQNVDEMVNRLIAQSYISGTSIYGWGIQAQFLRDAVDTALGAMAIERTTQTISQSNYAYYALRYHSALESIEADRFGWVVNSDPDIFVSSLVYYVVNTKYGTTVFDPQWIRDSQNTAGPAAGSYGNGIVDTCAVLLWVDGLLEGARNDAVSYLLSQQGLNGGWDNDPYLTGFCLETLLKLNP